jgi:multisubunit Na+/H+ antiporter MnhF subunit
VIAAIAVVLVAAGTGFTVRLLCGPSLADRIVGLDGLIVVGMIGIAANAVTTGSGAFLPVLIVLSLVGFVSTAVVARFIEGREQP